MLGAGAASGEGGAARGPASPRPRPPATARALGAPGQGRAGLSRVRAKAVRPCRHTGAAPAARGAAAAGPGGTWPPASPAGPSGPWGCLARPPGRRLSPSGSCWPPRGPRWPWPPLRPPRRHPRREAAKPDGRDCGSRASAAGFQAAAGRSLRAAARSAGPARPARGWPPGGSRPGRRTAPPAAVGRRPHGLASPRHRRCRHPHEPGRGGPARGCPHRRPHRRSSRAWWRHHACATSVPSQPRSQRRGPRGRRQGAGDFGARRGGRGHGGREEVAGGGCWLGARGGREFARSEACLVSRGGAAPLGLRSAASSHTMPPGSASPLSPLAEGGGGEACILRWVLPGASVQAWALQEPAGLALRSSVTTAGYLSPDGTVSKPKIMIR